jgi:hypothetical protein
MLQLLPICKEAPEIKPVQLRQLPDDPIGYSDPNMPYNLSTSSSGRSCLRSRFFRPAEVGARIVCRTNQRITFSP